MRALDVPCRSSSSKRSIRFRFGIPGKVIAMFKLPFVARSQPSQPQSQPLSPRTAEKASRLRGATVTDGLCPYCAVGCSQLLYTKDGQLIDIEGDPQPDQ